MKKILIFSLSYYPHMGGAEIAIKEITDRIDPSDMSFHLICNRFDSTLPKSEKVGNVMVHRVGFGRRGADSVSTHRPLFYFAKIAFVPLSALKALSLHRRERFDGFWAMMAYMTFPITIARAFGACVHYILTLQEGDPFEHVFSRLRIRLFLPLLRHGIRHASVVQTISSFLGGWARQMGFEGPLEVIPNGVDRAHFSQTYNASVLAKTKRELTGKDENIVLIHTGRMVRKNGLPDVIYALAQLPPNVTFVQIGKGPDEAALRALVDECGVSKRVRFLGFVDHTELPRYLQASDIFVRPSLSEGMGNSLIEAMAAGVPVIATQEGGIKDFLFDPKRDPSEPPTGRAVLPNDPQGIARAVALFLEHKTTTGQIVENARTMVREKYDWDTIVHDMRSRVFLHI